MKYTTRTRQYGEPKRAMGMLFDCSSDNIGLHLKNIYESGELIESATAEKISVVRHEGSREVNRSLQFYNQEAKEHAETEYEKFRVIQDRMFISDFDKYLGNLPFEDETNCPQP